ncbi:mechanosensitive ion channel family protein [Desulfatibacillum aliphaticivorans]|nr:mechanosensitive ion channel domain-containing protein [Desulfatibacillum aliphaticivorans]
MIAGKNTFPRLFFLVGAFLSFILMGFLVCPGAALSGPNDEDSALTAPPEGLIATKPSIYADMQENIGKSQKEVKAEREIYKARHTALKDLEDASQSELNSYRLQLAAYEQVLLLDDAHVNDLQKLYSGQRIASFNISSRLKELREEMAKYSNAKRQAQEHLRRWREQRQTLANQAGQGNQAVAPPLAELDALLESLGALESLLQEIEGIYNGRIASFEEVNNAFSDFLQQLRDRSARTKNLDVFQKSSPFRSVIGFQTLWGELGELAFKIKHPFQQEYWSQVVPGGAQFVVWSAVLFFFFTLGFAYLIGRRARKMLDSRKGGINRERQKWSWTGMCLVNQSVILVCLILFLFGYEKIHASWPSITTLKAVKASLIVWLVTGWAICLARMTPELLSFSIPFDKFEKMAKMLRFLLIVYAVLWWNSGVEGGLAVLGRVVIAVCVMIWAGLSWRWTVRTKGVHAVAKGLALTGLGIALVALIAEFQAYAYFAHYWLASWGLTVWTALGAFASFGVLHEWRLQIREHEKSVQEEQSADSRPVRWLTMRMGLLGWFMAGCSLLFAAWDVDRKAFAVIFDVISREIVIGSISISILGILYAVLALWCTHALARVFADLFRNKFLADSGLETGFQESLTTLASYAIWTIGILLSLSLLGVSSTSMAVVFGALGIGLGFGLQAIFNNFMSGLILLFERPIQVGDILEVNGTWGEVKKINVRSTVVQTYDNASLIIPNSDMISNQVTNWSFKDPKVRRNLYVGVAYGSDIVLVRDTLQEVVDKNPRIYKRPKPDVLFTDFGDSSLMFRVRFWTHVDYFLSVETELRFEIDRLFRERKIEIPFPQRDLHIKTAAAFKNVDGLFKQKQEGEKDLGGVQAPETESKKD